MAVRLDIRLNLFKVKKEELPAAVDQWIEHRLKIALEG
jgi:hypothetical protein